MMCTMNASESVRPDRTLLIILSAIGVLVIVALAVVFSRGEPKLLDESTPAGVVQRYSAAVIAGDESAAVEYLTPEAQEACDRFENASTDNVRVTLVSTTEREDSADVKVSLVTSYEGGGPFDSSEYETEEVFDLVKSDGKWLIDRTPWPLTVCTNTAVK